MKLNLELPHVIATHLNWLTYLYHHRKLSMLGVAHRTPPSCQTTQSACQCDSCLMSWILTVMAGSYIQYMSHALGKYRISLESTYVCNAKKLLSGSWVTSLMYLHRFSAAECLFNRRWSARSSSPFFRKFCETRVLNAACTY